MDYAQTCQASTEKMRFVTPPWEGPAKDENMYLTAAQLRALAQAFEALSEDYGEEQIRRNVGDALLRLLGADQFASFVWHDTDSRFMSRVAIHMDDTNLAGYEQYFQFRDPITPQLRVRRQPTLVNQILAQNELVKTEFYNDFLRKDGLYYGVNVYAYDGDTNIGDLRIWRSRRRSNFDADALRLLAMVQPAFTLALKRVRRKHLGVNSNVPLLSPHGSLLTPKEWEIARRVCNGLPDKQIARDLGIEFTTVRTHLTRIYGKLGVNNRSQLIRQLLAQER